MPDRTPLLDQASKTEMLRMHAFQMAQLLKAGAVTVGEILDVAEAIYQFIIKEDVQDEG